MLYACFLFESSPSSSLSTLLNTLDKSVAVKLPLRVLKPREDGLMVPPKGVVFRVFPIADGLFVSGVFPITDDLFITVAEEVAVCSCSKSRLQLHIRRMYLYIIVKIPPIPLIVGCKCSVTTQKQSCKYLLAGRSISFCAKKIRHKSSSGLKGSDAHNQIGPLLSTNHWCPPKKKQPMTKLSNERNPALCGLRQRTMVCVTGFVITDQTQTSARACLSQIWRCSMIVSLATLGWSEFWNQICAKMTSTFWTLDSTWKPDLPKLLRSRHRPHHCSHALSNTLSSLVWSEQHFQLLSSATSHLDTNGRFSDASVWLPSPSFPWSCSIWRCLRHPT